MKRLISSGYLKPREVVQTRSASLSDGCEVFNSLDKTAGRCGAPSAALAVLACDCDTVAWIVCQGCLELVVRGEIGCHRCAPRPVRLEAALRP